jgi:hypothetical protein
LFFINGIKKRKREKNFMGFDTNGDGQLDHPLLFYFYIILISLNVLDIATTSVALTNPMNCEGNPLMADILPYTPIIKLLYLFGILLVADYLEGKYKNRGVYLLAIACIVTMIIVANNILILRGM